VSRTAPSLDSGNERYARERQQQYKKLTASRFAGSPSRCARRRAELWQRLSADRDSTDELTLVFDLAIYTAKEGRTRAIDRYAKAAQLPAGSDEIRMLEAMCRARFSIWRIECRHDICGLVPHFRVDSETLYYAAMAARSSPQLRWR
jgi:hypothetical protein